MFISMILQQEWFIEGGYTYAAVIIHCTIPYGCFKET